MNKIIGIVLLAAVAFFLLNCRTWDVVNTTWAATATSLPTRTPQPTFTPLPSPTPFPTERPTPPRRPTLKGEKVLPTLTPKPVPTNPPMTVPPAPTLSPWEYIVDPGVRMETAPNCGTVYFEGGVADQNGAPVNGVAVEISFFDNKPPVRFSGEGKGDGEFGFAPLDKSSFHTRIDFALRLVRSEKDRTPISETLVVPFVDCAKEGQFTKIWFKKVR